MSVLLTACVALTLSAPPTVPELVDQLKGCESLETCTSVKALIQRGPSIWPAVELGLKAPDEMTRFWTLGVLSEVTVAASQGSIAALLDDREIRVRAAAAYALGAHRDKAVTPWLLKALKDKDLNVRFAAVVGLGRVRDPAAIPDLIGALRDKDEDVRGYAALALGDIRDRVATPKLIERLREDLKPQVRGFAAMALSKLKDPKSLAPLMAQAREEKDAKALAAALHALGELGDPKALPVIEPHLTHPSVEVQEYAKDALKRLKKG
ncbi:MAG: HEAT repeat domain-containing protein [Myxococcota bacterium]